MKKLIPYVLLLAITFVASCKKEDFDEPSPDGEDPALVANTTIAQLKDGYVSGVFDSISTDMIISGIVTADDKSGNFYKTLIIQDATAAIAIRVDVSDYYTKYPIGRRIFVKCKGLWLGDYRELIQLGGFVDNTDPQEPSVEPIPYALVNKFIVPGKYNLTVAPTVVTIDELTSNTLEYQNMLIQLNDVQFAESDTALNYAELLLSVNRTLENCDGDEIAVRSSNYATFADVNLPNGKGPLVAIFSVFGTGPSAPQIFIRDTYDVNLTGLRCGQVNPTLPVISTNAVSSVTSSSAVSGGNITNSGTSPVITYGVCWNTTGSPTTADSKTTNAGPFTGSFTSNLTGLTANAQYYVRAYATNLSGTVYGNERSFIAVAGGGGPQLVTIQTTRSYFTGTITTAPALKKIEGIVTSDRTNLNTDPRNLVIQDATAGIVVRFSSNHNFNPGDQVEVDISGQELSEFNGLLQVNNVPNANASQTGTGTITPAVLTISDINANFESLESTLVRVNGATITGSGTTYSGSRTLTDATGSMTLYTRSQATFSGATYPTNTVSVTGILIPFNNTRQITIRNTSDIQ